MTLITKIFTIAITITSILLQGCVPTIRLSPEQAQKLKTIRVDPNITVPAKMSYSGPGLGPLSLVLGPIAGTIANGVAGESTQTKIQSLIKTNHILISSILRTAVINELKSKTPYKIVNRKNSADANMKLTIRLYGMAIAEGFSTHVSPILSVKGTMTDRQGKIIWQDLANVMPFYSGTPSYYPQDLIKHPHLLYKALHSAALYVAADLRQTIVPQKAR